MILVVEIYLYGKGDPQGTSLILEVPSITSLVPIN